MIVGANDRDVALPAHPLESVPDPTMSGVTAARRVPCFLSARVSSSVSFRVAPPGGGPRGSSSRCGPAWMMMRFVPRSVNWQA